MRADRLVSMMLMLHAEGRLTASDLSERLEVSERTVYRDIDALSIAGVPVYTQSGVNGGIFLDEDYRISLTGLSQDQLFALFATAEAGPMADLGLKRAAEDSLLKLFAALPRQQRQDVEALRSRIYIDPHGWFHDEAVPRLLPTLQQAIWEDRQLSFEYQAVGADVQTRVVDAYALVSKSDVWYLVGRKPDGQMRSYRLSRIKAITLMDTHYERDPEFDLAAYWQSTRANFKQQMNQHFSAYEVILRVRPDMFWYFGSFMEGRYERLSTSPDNGWITVKIITGGIDEAVMHVLGLANAVWVDSPDELRERVYTQARAVVSHIDDVRGL